jgi:hypothetical protein
MVPVTVEYTLFGDADPPERACALQVTSDESADEDSVDTDWQVQDAHHVSLRAERAGHGSGRVYTVTAICTDRKGREARRSVTVRVPLGTHREFRP